MINHSSALRAPLFEAFSFHIRKNLFRYWKLVGTSFPGWKGRLVDGGAASRGGLEAAAARSMAAATEANPAENGQPSALLRMLGKRAVERSPSASPAKADAPGRSEEEPAKVPFELGELDEDMEKGEAPRHHSPLRSMGTGTASRISVAIVRLRSGPNGTPMLDVIKKKIS